MLQAAIREGQQRSIQGALGVLQDGIVLVDVLHDFRVEFILLEIDSSAIIFTIKSHTAVRTLGLRVCLSGVIGDDLTTVRIQLWQVSKQRKGQLMAQQTTLA